MSGPRIGVDPDAVAAGVKRLWRAIDGNGASTDLSQMPKNIAQVEGGSGIRAMTRFMNLLRADLMARAADAGAFHNNVNIDIKNLQAAVDDLMKTDEAAGHIGQQLLGQVSEATGVSGAGTPVMGGARASGAPRDGSSAQPEQAPDQQTTTQSEYA